MDVDSTAQPPAQPDPPVLRVLSGEPSPEDLAVITAILSAAGSTNADTTDQPPRTWAAYWRQVRPTMRPGPGAWRASSRPR